MRSSPLLLTVLLLLEPTLSLGCNCYENCENPRNCKLGSKTPYRFIQNLDDSRISFPGCTEEKIWLLIRHGTRYSGTKVQDKMTNLLPKIRDSIVNSYRGNASSVSLPKIVIEELEEWSPPKFAIDRNAAKYLAAEGEREMIDLGERYQARFPNLFPEVYRNETYQFKYTGTQRTEESGKHFTIGLFGRYGSQAVKYLSPEHADPVLRFYKRCQRWKQEVDKNPAAYFERDQFILSDVVNKTVQRISHGLGIQLDYESVHLIRTTCTFETAWNIYKGNSPWCEIFQPEDLEVLEYIEDLKHYWVSGYGYAVSYEQACPTLVDLLDFFESKSSVKTTAYFTHSGAILKVLSLLGVAREDDPLNYKSYELHRKTRAWRTSLIDAFASNIAFVLYRCGEEKNPEMKILMMHQERIVQLPGCPVPCPLEMFKAEYPVRREDCRFDNICSTS